MSLVVARIINDKVAIVADTLLSFPGQWRPRVEGGPDSGDRVAMSLSRFPEDHVLKIRILSSKTAVAFAGTELAGSAFESLLHRNEADVLSEIWNWRNEHGQADFLVATTDPKLYLVTRDGVESVTKAAIGDEEAIRGFYTAERAQAVPAEFIQQHDPFWSLDGPLLSIISDPKYSSVGGLPVRLLMSNEGFKYQTRGVRVVGEGVEQHQPPAGEFAPVRAGGAAEGAFCGDLFDISAPFRTVAAYTPQGRLGIVFAPDELGHYRGVKRANTDAAGFYRWLQQDFGIDCEPLALSLREPPKYTWPSAYPPGTPDLELDGESGPTYPADVSGPYGTGPMRACHDGCYKITGPHINVELQLQKGQRMEIQVSGPGPGGESDRQQSLIFLPPSKGGQL